jgi:hypothetical protein
MSESDASEEITWECLVQVTAQKGQDGTRIPFPEMMHFVSKEKNEGESYVMWHYDRDYYHIVLSSHELRDEQYQEITDSKIYRRESVDVIRPPEGGDSDFSLKHRFSAGDRLTYLYHSGMKDDEVRSVHLLNQDQLTNLLGKLDAEGEMWEQLSKIPNLL